MRSIPSTTSIAPAASFSASQHSPWHSPVPYLFGGLAAMLGLIAFALLILACSYWKLSAHLQDEEAAERDLEREKQGDSATKETARVYEEKILVIMAGDNNPTFLATPSLCSNLSSFGDGIGKAGVEAHDNSEKPEKEMQSDVEVLVTTPTETENP